MALSTKEITQAEEAFKNKEYSQAITILNDIIKKNPDYAPAYRRIGSILMLSQSQDKALDYFNKAIELAPDDGESWKALGYFHKDHEAWTEALQAFQKSLELSGENAQIYYESQQIQSRLGNLSNALEIAQKLLQMEPDNAIYLWKYAQLLKEMDRKDEALQQYDLLVQSGVADIPIDAIEEWLDMTKQYGGHGLNLRDQVEMLSLSSPDHPMLKFLYAQSCVAKGEVEKALQLFSETYLLVPDNLKILEKLSGAYNMMGYWDKSLKCLSQILDKEPLNIQALASIGSQHKYAYGDSTFRQLNIAEVHIAELKVKERTVLHYALGKAYDDVGDLATAFEHYKSGGILNSQGKHHIEYTSLQHLSSFVAGKMTKDICGKYIEEGCKSQKPIFILGMPRSGTSLIEQVLSGIEGVYGAGELNYSIPILNGMKINDFRLIFEKKGDYFRGERYPTQEERGKRYLEMLEALAPSGTKRIINKMPDNFSLLGFLYLILPNASIIHSRRHPIETCLSAYRLNFAQGQYWSDDLRRMGKYYRLYTELMSHWESVLPEGKILDVRYEDMVNDLETESKRLADHIGMQWDPTCLAFHKSKRAVRTASFSQVRQPIYKSSTNRWQKYKLYLKPLLYEIGDLVEEYESELLNNYS